jgi:L-aminopeptidase/D-esterase-like protein
MRISDYGIKIGEMNKGKLNKISDVEGITKKSGKPTTLVVGWIA